MKISQKYLEEFSVHLKKLGRLSATVDSYTRDAKRFFVYLETHSIKIDQVLAETLIEYKKHLEQSGETQNTVRRATIGVRQFFRFLVKAEHISSSPFEMVAIPQRNEELPVQLSELDIKKILNAAQSNHSSLQGRRNALILCLLAYDGLKATEIINLMPGSILHSNSKTSIHISGTKARNIEVDENTRNACLAYERSLKEFLDLKAITDTSEYHYLISFKGKDQAVVCPKMSRHGLKFIIYELGEEAGINKLNGERLRHFALEYMLDKGLSNEAIMSHLGLRRLGNISKHLQTRKS